MSSLATLIILCAIAAASLIIASVVNNREVKTKLVRQKLKQLKMRAEELEELVINLDQLVESRAIPKLINDEVIDLVSAMVELDSSARYLEASLINARKRAEELAIEREERSIVRLKESDSQIARTKHMLNEAGVVLRKQHANGRLTIYELETFISELAWTQLMVDVISLIGQGHKATNRHDVLTAHAFYKKAKHILAHAPHPDPRRFRMIKELGEILANKRRALSLDLMPENFYNPGEKSGTSDNIGNNPLSELFSV